MKVLLIEDNKDIADMVRLCLESENIVCEATGDGKAGLRSIKEDKFDAILLDLAIPEFSGFDIFRELKNDDILKSNNVSKDFHTLLPFMVILVKDFHLLN